MNEIKIAKIKAWQAIIVALIGGIVGISGTVGLKYYDSYKKMSEKDAKVKKLTKTIKISAHELSKSPQSVLRIAKVKIDKQECLDRLYSWHMSEPFNNSGRSFSASSTSYDGYFTSSFKGVIVRAACLSTDNKVVISISYMYLDGKSMDVRRASKIADNIEVSLKNPIPEVDP